MILPGPSFFLGKGKEEGKMFGSVLVIGAVLLCVLIVALLLPRRTGGRDRGARAPIGRRGAGATPTTTIGWSARGRAAGTPTRIADASRLYAERRIGDSGPIRWSATAASANGRKRTGTAMAAGDGMATDR